MRVPMRGQGSGNTMHGRWATERPELSGRQRNPERRWPSKPLLVCAAWLGGMSGSSSAQALSISDGTFNSGDWTDELILDSSGSASYTVSQLSVGGNPSAYRETVHSWPMGSNIGVAHLQANATYDPSDQGPLLSVGFSMDLFNEDEGIPSDLVAYDFLVRQGSTYYASSGTSISDTSVWTPFSATGLVPSDFAKIAGPGPDNPDFSISGSELQFGYLSRNSSVGSFPPLASGIDNWSVSGEADALPVPAVSPRWILFLVFTLALGGIVALRLPRSFASTP